MTKDPDASWLPIIAVFLLGCSATALVPQTVPILGKLATEFGVARDALGWVVSLPSLACALGAFAFGLVIDRMGDRVVLYAGVVVVAAGDFLVTHATSVPLLMSARIIQGLGYIALTVAGATFVLRTTEGEHRRKAMALWAAHTPAGFAAAILFVTPLARPDADWRWAFWGHAMIVLVVGLLAWSVVRSRAGGSFGRSIGMKDVLTNVRVYRIGLASLSSALLQTGLMTVIVSHLGRHYGTKPTEAALYVLIAMAANLSGAIIVVMTPVRKAPSVTLLGSAGIAAAAGLLIMLAAFHEIGATVVTLIAFAGFLGIANSLIWSFMGHGLLSPQASGALGGFITQTTFIGVLVGPPIFFALSGAGHGSYTLATMVALLLLMAIAAPIFNRRIPRTTPDAGHSVRSAA
jgi:predicted MFS family arabinose efflux permease